MAKLPTGRFPFISLAKSLDRAQAIFENDKEGKGLKIPVAFSAWEYSEKSSGGFQTIAALKGYGLLVDEGANDDRSVKLTSKSRTYFQSELDDQKAGLAADFAKSPPLFGHLLEHWDGDEVADPVARTYLKTEIGLNEQSARAALGIYKDNLRFLSPKGSAKVSDELPDHGGSGEQEQVVTVQASTAHNQSSPIGQSAPAASAALASPGPSFNLNRTDEGYVIYLGGSVATKGHAEEVIAMLTQLKCILPDTPHKTAQVPE